MDPTTTIKIKVAFYTVILPAVVVAGVALGGSRAARGRVPTQVLTALALAAGAITAYLGVVGWPELRADESFLGFAPPDTMHWIPLVTVGTLLAFIGLDLRGRRAGVGGVALIGENVLAVALFLLMTPLVELGEGAGPTKTLALGVIAFAVPWAVVDRAAARVPGAAVLAALATAATGAAVAALFGETALFAQLLGALAAALGAGAVVLWRRPSLSLGHAAVGVVFATFAAMVAYVHLYATMPRTGVLLLALAPLAVLAALPVRSTVKAALLAAGIAAVPAALAAWTTHRAAAEAAAASEKGGGDDYEDYYY